MNHLLIAPIVLPALVGPFIILVLRYHIDLQRIFAIASCVFQVILGIVMVSQANSGLVQIYELGNWQAPFGIVLVLDRLSAMMVLLTASLGLAVVLYATGSRWDERGENFHALFQFQLMGIIGAFLTGDAFNLFVFFEVLLIASYGLMIHAGGTQRFLAGTQYVVFNLLGSALFLLALGTIYSVTGTLNMADIAQRVAEIPIQDSALIRVGAMMLFLVFSIKAALLPLHFWLPASYANAPLPVAALFAIMTKVGAYAILRMYTLAFGPDVAATAGLLDMWFLPAALLTLLIGAIGVLGSREIGRLMAFAALSSVGTLLTAIALMTPVGTAAALYYMIHSTLTAALAFLIADQIFERRGGEIAVKPVMSQNGLLSALFFIAAIAIAGMPPLSGFLGKIMVLDAARAHPLAPWIWGVILGGSLITMMGFARAGTLIFWSGYGLDQKKIPISQNHDNGETDEDNHTSSRLTLVVCFALIGPLIAHTALAGYILRYTEATAQSLFNPQVYIETVLANRDRPVTSSHDDDDAHAQHDETQSHVSTEEEH